MANPNPNPATRFAKGKSGNPRGRPQTKPLTEELRKALAARPFGQQQTTNLELVVNEVIQRAQAGDMAAIRLCWEYIEGKPVQPQEVSGPEGGPLRFTIRLGAARGDSDQSADG